MTLLNKTHGCFSTLESARYSLQTGKTAFSLRMLGKGVNSYNQETVLRIRRIRSKIEA